jgi:hypothetical protein
VDNYAIRKGLHPRLLRGGSAGSISSIECLCLGWKHKQFHPILQDEDSLDCDGVSGAHC